MYANPFNGTAPCIRFDKIRRNKGGNLQLIAHYMNKEVFVHSFLFPDLMIGNRGTIYNMRTEAVCNHRFDKDGYHKVSCRKNLLDGTYKIVSIGVHRLIMIAFEYRPDYEALHVNHKDMDINNNFYHPIKELSNLEWSTPCYNTQHMLVNRYGDKYHIYTEAELWQICDYFMQGKSDMEISQIMNIPYKSLQRTLYSIRNREPWNGIVFADRYPEMTYPHHKRVRSEDDVIKMCDVLMLGGTIEESLFTLANNYNIHETKSFLVALKNNMAKEWEYITTRYNFPKRCKRVQHTEQQIRQICEMLLVGYSYDYIYQSTHLCTTGLKYRSAIEYIKNLMNNKIVEWRHITSQYFPM